MKIFINDEELDFTLENEKTCGDILNQLEIEFEKNNGTIFSIKINDKEIGAEEIETISAKPIEEIENINIVSIFASDIIQTFKTLCPKIEEINKDFEDLPIYLQGTNQGKIPVILTKFADIFDNLCHVISLTPLFPETFNNIKIDDKNFSDFIKEFSPFLADFENAIKENDTVTIGDIAEYEIKPRFESLINVIKEF